MTTNPLYRIKIAGDPPDALIADLCSKLEANVSPYGFRLGDEIEVEHKQAPKQSSNLTSQVVVYFGSQTCCQSEAHEILKLNAPIIPVVDDLSNIGSKLPSDLLRLNCLSITDGGSGKLASTALECLGLLPRQRRVFLSYKRSEAREAALQIHDLLSSKVFDVFLDTHGIPPAEDFQEMLWHRLCDSDVLIMLDTPGYFDSRWTSAEFGRALAKGISVLRIGWPDTTLSRRAETASHVNIASNEIDQHTGRLTTAVLERMLRSLEQLRSESLAARMVNMFSTLRHEVEKIGGSVGSLGPYNFVDVRLPSGSQISVCATLSVPTAVDLHNASLRCSAETSAVIFDHVGLSRSHLSHLEWISKHVKNPKWVKACEAGWQFADWEQDS